jgi:outer membrane protein assembly factor BamA
MTRRLVATFVLGLVLGGVAHVASAAPKLVANPGQWHRYQGRLVKRIEITGLRRTRTWRLRQLLDTRVGRPLDAETLRHDLRRIRNLQLFRPLRVRVDPEGKGVVIRIQTRDKWSLLPYFNMFFNLGSVSAITGVYDVNTLGFLSYVDLQVMLFSYLPLTAKSIRPGFLFVLQVPRLGGLPFSYYINARAQMTLRAQVGGLVLPESIFLIDYFQVERYGGYHSLTWEPFQWFRVGVQQILRYDRYKLVPDAEPLRVPLPEAGLTHAFAVTAGLGYTRYRNYMQHGLILSLALEGAAKSLGSDSKHVRFYGQGRAYYDFGSRWGNLAARVGGGYMKGGSYSNLFALGSWTGLRGFFTAQFTARSYVYGNLEYRTGLVRTGFPIASIVPAFRGKVFQLQGAVFADVGGVAGGGAYRTEEHGVPLLAIGAGLRLAVVNLYKAILRIDFAYTLSPYRSFDLIIATQQYF